MKTLKALKRLGIAICKRTVPEKGKVAMIRFGIKLAKLDSKVASKIDALALRVMPKERLYDKIRRVINGLR